jgi:hypothetical protein
MAEVIGVPSEYINKHIRKDIRWYIFPAIACIIGAWLAYAFIFDTYGRNNFYVSSVFFLVYLFVLGGVYYVVRWAANTDKWIKGGDGESVVRDLLVSLPDEYIAYQSIKITGTPYDIDFVVVGPTGIFTIDAKNIKGFIGYSNGRLTQNGYSVKKNILWQAQQESKFIHQLIQDKLGAIEKVHPVLCFTSKFSKLRFGRKPVKGVTIIRLEWLNDVITKNYFYRYTINRKLIEQELKKICIQK